MSLFIRHCVIVHLLGLYSELHMQLVLICTVQAVLLSNDLQIISNKFIF